MTDKVIIDECDAELKSRLHAPNSYEHISLLVSDTIRKSENMQLDLQSYDQRKKSVFDDGRVAQHERDSVMAEIKKTRNNPAIDSIELFILKISYRAKNKAGAIKEATSTIYYYPRINGRKAWISNDVPRDLLANKS